uniref:Melanocortin 2 receptor accessory protein n=1 Tax=Accipiter nisus TaxID=211598 RepID=A0A8B9RPN3_9AVES
MANRTNSSEYFWSYEYYWDYIDPIPVDGSKLKVNKYSIVIAFWVGLAAFVTFLFLILLYMSRSGSTPVKEIKSISFSRSSGSEMLLVNCLHLLEHWCPIQEPHDNYQVVKYCTKMQWLEADATQTQMYHIFSVRVMIHWNNLE